MGLNQTIDVTPEQHRTILRLMGRHLPETDVWAHGSRVRWTSRPQSDLDLIAFAGPGQRRQVSDLREAFDESNLPFRVDLLVWDEVPESFQAQINEYHVALVEVTHLAGHRNQHSDHSPLEAEPGWIACNWGDLATLEYGKPLRDYRTASGQYRVFGTNGPIGWSPEPLCDRAGVIVGRKGAYRGIQYSPQPFFVIDTAFYLKPTAQVDAQWAYYQLLTHDINGLDSGSAVPSTNREAFYALPVTLPPLPEQRVIAHILGTLDDKIALSRRLTATLDAMVRALFKSWFVDFEPVRAKVEGRDTGLPQHIADLFPDRLVDSEFGKIPESWEHSTLDNIVFLNPELWNNQNTTSQIAYVDLSNTKWGYIERVSSFAWEDAPTRARRVLRDGDTILGTVRPSNGSFALIPKDGLTGSTAFAVLRPVVRTDRELIWCAATAADNIDRLSRLADGGAYPAVHPNAVAETKIVLADEATRRGFSLFAAPIVDQMEAHKSRSIKLMEVRRTLLPKLVSGEVRVSKWNGDLEDSV